MALGVKALVSGAVGKYNALALFRAELNSMTALISTYLDILCDGFELCLYCDITG